MNTVAGSRGWAAVVEDEWLIRMEIAETLTREGWRVIELANGEAAMQLLRNEFSNLSQWAGNVVATRDNLDATNSVRPDVMQSDLTLAKITECSRFLGSMLVSGSFADNPSCH